jgi:hypothetical protein
MESILARRIPVDLSSFSVNCGKIGCLQTLGVRHVLPGDSIQGDIQVKVDMSPRRRPANLDVQVDLFAFYEPSRHIYGNDDWIAFIKAGLSETTTFGVYTSNATTQNHCLGTHIDTGVSVRKDLFGIYSRIWNFFFKDQAASSDMADNFFEGNSDLRNYYGQLCCFTKRFWNTGMPTSIVDADKNVSAAGNEVDLTEFAQQIGLYKSELKRSWFARRYKDVMRELYGTIVSREVEQRPELIARQTSYLSGRNVQGHDDANLGTVQGVTSGEASLRFPPRFFPEHGLLFIMALVRIPRAPVYWEMDRLMLPANAEPDYKSWCAEYDVMQNEPPLEMYDGACWFQDGNSNSLGEKPYGYWHMEAANFMHPDYITVGGSEFLNTTFATEETARYHTLTMYDDMFYSMKLAQWQCRANLGLKSLRLLPDPRASIFAGTKH